MNEAPARRSSTTPAGRRWPLGGAILARVILRRAALAGNPPLQLRECLSIVRSRESHGVQLAQEHELGGNRLHAGQQHGDHRDVAFDALGDQRSELEHLPAPEPMMAAEDRGGLHTRDRRLELILERPAWRDLFHIQMRSA